MHSFLFLLTQMFTFNQNTFCFLATGCMRGFKSVPHSDLLELVLHYSVLFMTMEINILVIISFFTYTLKKKS